MMNDGRNVQYCDLHRVMPVRLSIYMLIFRQAALANTSMATPSQSTEQKF